MICQRHFSEHQCERPAWSQARLIHMASSTSSTKSVLSNLTSNWEQEQDSVTRANEDWCSFLSPGFTIMTLATKQSRTYCTVHQDSDMFALSIFSDYHEDTPISAISTEIFGFILSELIIITDLLQHNYLTDMSGKHNRIWTKLLPANQITARNWF